ncbi:hypothetical protein EV690_3403 [Celerinatantimonas diazotrophica]|uniref:Uncharacterized protein n=1 Tax=Celerinatantimonas diazotrophica TaxID=412034 RepID=A0A4R1J8A8_9GAMM|nr:hypothetical protein EV690_3403 [Celerinatantimonas diazotrophica]CAG9295518.1 hypothetical protein CEDIAZO_00634 [Celerinatantimonas diazotrophica]
MRLNEPQGQYLRGIYPALNVLCGEYYTAQRLPCLNPSQISAKLITKGQQSLGIQVQDKIKAAQRPLLNLLKFNQYHYSSRWARASRAVAAFLTDFP